MDETEVESGEGIESRLSLYSRHHITSLMWNPVKELKVYSFAALNRRDLVLWNPVKELKVI